MPQFTVSTEDRVYREDTLHAYQRGVERAIQVMHARLGEPLTVDDLATVAFMSRHHFTRVFAKITGISPARFLAAIRMQEAKRLLLETDRSVTDICFDVGYNSLGTFTRIFADFVGYPPVRFRQLALPVRHATVRLLKETLPSSLPVTNVSTISGIINCPVPLAMVTVALFPSAIPRSHPIECICLDESLRFSFSKRPTHRSHLFAVGLLPHATIEDALLFSRQHLAVGSIQFSQFNVMHCTHTVVLSQPRVIDPPIVLAFPLFFLNSI